MRTSPDLNTRVMGSGHDGVVLGACGFIRQDREAREWRWGAGMRVFVIPAKYRAPYGTTRLTKTRCRPVIGTYGMVM